MNQPLPPAVVMGLSPTGLHVVRVLGRAGVPVTGVADGIQAGAASRYCGAVISGSDPAERLDNLCAAFPESTCKPVLIPTSDQDIDLVIDNAERLSRHFRFQGSYGDGLARQIMDKARFYQLCEAQDVAYPRLWSGTREQIKELGSGIAFPCMIKPALIQLLKGQMKGRKGWIARDAQEYDAQVAQIPDGAGTLLVQEIVPGPESNITLWCGYLGGGEAQGFTARKLRQFPPGFGSASLVQSHPEPETAQIAMRLLTSLGYRGIAAAEFKTDPNTGQLKMIEVNTRPSLWFSISEAAGRPVVLQAYRDLAGLPAQPPRPQQDGIRWRYGPKDLYSRLFYAFNRGFILPAPDVETAGPAHHRTYAVFAWDDPKPALAELGNFAYKAWARLKGGRHGG